MAEVQPFVAPLDVYTVTNVNMPNLPHTDGKQEDTEGWRLLEPELLALNPEERTGTAKYIVREGGDYVDRLARFFEAVCHGAGAVAIRSEQHRKSKPYFDRGEAFTPPDLLTVLRWFSVDLEPEYDELDQPGTEVEIQAVAGRGKSGATATAYVGDQKIATATMFANLADERTRKALGAEHPGTVVHLGHPAQNPSLPTVKSIYGSEGTLTRLDGIWTLRRGRIEASAEPRDDVTDGHFEGNPIEPLTVEVALGIRGLLTEIKAHRAEGEEWRVASIPKVEAGRPARQKPGEENERVDVTAQSAPALTQEQADFDIGSTVKGNTIEGTVGGVRAFYAEEVELRRVA